MLEVGPGPGQFLDMARDRGFACVGAEPDSEMAANLRARGHQVVEDVFPSSEFEGRKFEVIAFNDVLEHIVDAHAVFEAAASSLAENGILLINLPNADGAMFRASAVFSAVGWEAPYKRMWQYGYPSPHVHYFTPKLLQRISSKFNFQEVASGALPAISLRGLSSRVGYTGEFGRLAAIATYGMAIGYLAVSWALPKDTTFHLFALDPDVGT